MIDLSKYFRAFKYKSLKEVLIILKIIERNNISIDDFKEYMQILKNGDIDNDPEIRNHISKLNQKNKKFSNKIFNCPKCNNALRLRESLDEDFESELFCNCGYIYYTDISIVDHQELLKARIIGVEMDFPPEEVRASKKERLRRRAICETCDQLTIRKICKACGCRMKHRTYYEILNCPKKKW